ADGVLVFCFYAAFAFLAGLVPYWVVGADGAAGAAIVLALGYLIVLYNFKEVSAYLSTMRLLSIFKIKELRQKVFITAMFLMIYRIGFHVPLPTINQAEMA